VTIYLSDGVVVLNAGLGADGDIRLAQTLATTMLEVFPNVFVLADGRIW
jgi:hypothetical protein